MKKDEIIDMIGEAPDAYVKDARVPGKRRRILRITKWMGGIAAALVIALLITGVPGIPMIVSAQTVSAASGSRKPERPENGGSKEWAAVLEERNTRMEGAVTPISDFTALVSEKLFSGRDDTNRLWSPINAYIALAMTAELTGGETQAELLELLGVSGLSELRSRVSTVWEEIYEDNGKEISVLANSLWLDDKVDYVQEKMDSVARNYYASVYRGDLGSDKTNRAMTNWLRNQTGGLLRDRTQKVKLEPYDQMLSIASTVYFQSKWADGFDASENTQGVFHGPGGDREVSFMNKKEYHMNYYWGENYSAVQMPLENGSVMWFILPDEGKTVDDILSDGAYRKLLSESAESKRMKVNLSVPRFDLSAAADLKETLQAVGLTRIFEKEGNDFSPSIRNAEGVYLDSIRQDTRVRIDEKGVAAASYIELDFGARSAEPPTDRIDFILDRPFVFAVTKRQIPLFAGAVNMP